MTEHVEEVATEKPKHAKPAKKAKPKREKKPFVAPEEFAGMTSTDCCTACYDNMAVAQAAQRRLNEIEMTYQRRPSPLRDASPTVMESDAEYLARNPQIAEEFKELGRALLGKCHITGHPGCAHPHKGGLASNSQRDPKASSRYQRAKKVLEHQKIDLRGF
jgi:hypothetical protein